MRNLKFRMRVMWNLKNKLSLLLFVRNLLVGCCTKNYRKLSEKRHLNSQGPSSVVVEKIGWNSKTNWPAKQTEWWIGEGERAAEPRDMPVEKKHPWWKLDVLTFQWQVIAEGRIGEIKGISSAPTGMSTLPTLPLGLLCLPFFRLFPHCRAWSQAGVWTRN